METSEYLPMFLAEGREHLQELNLAVVRIEERPDDQDTVDEIFRIAHSLKGMSATMGFAGMAALTHEMEDVFELLRQRKGGLPREAIDVLLECLDALSAAVEAIDESGEEQIEPKPLITRLKGLIRDNDDAEDESRRRPRRPPRRPSTSRSSPTAVASSRSAPRSRTTSRSRPCAPTWSSPRSPSSVRRSPASPRRTTSRPSAAPRSTSGWSPSAPTPSSAPWSAPCPTSPTSRSSRPSATPPSTTGEVPSRKRPRRPTRPSKAAAAPKKSGGHGKGSSTVRVDAERLDQLMHFMGELVLHRTQVEALAADADVPGLSQAMQNLTRTSHALQAMVMQVRMIPVEAVFLRFPRLVRDLSTKLSKQVELELVGKDTELDRTVVDALGDPLVHLIRNSLDHGLEGPEERQKAGKPASGTLHLSARHAGGNVVIEVRDDGRGINPAKVAQKAAERGLIGAEAVETTDMAKAIELLFHPGFSTADVTSDISGRGVGMDAVRTTIRELGGEVIMTSEQGQGTVSQIRLPLTLAIMAALLVEADGRPFAIPLDRIERTVRLADHTVRSVAGSRMLVMRDGVLPIVDASERFGGPATPEAEYAVVVRGATGSLAVTVGTLFGQRELVTRPLPPEVAENSALSGAAVMSDGQIALIVDCDAVETSAPALATA